MKFRVIDTKTGKEADTYEIALHEEWAKGLIYCDMEGFAITEDGYLVLMDECGHVVYCDSERFKVVFEDDRPHGEWKPLKWEDEETKCKLLDYPYDGKWVIVTDGKNISVERIKIDALDHFSPAGRWFELEDVVAWMPLPEPYQKEGDAE